MPNPYGHIYLIENKVNGKIYVGQTTKNPSEIWKEHLYGARTKAKMVIHKSIKKYGEQNFLFKVVCQAFTKEQLDALESNYILLLRSYVKELGYNLLLSSRPFLVSEEARKRMSEGQKKRFGNSKHPRLGAIVSEESKQKMRDKLIGKPRPDNAKRQKEIVAEKGTERLKQISKLGHMARWGKHVS